MNRERSILVSGIFLMATLLVSGCWHPQQQGATIVAPQQNPAPAEFMPTPEHAVTDVTQALAIFDARAFQLPGNGEVAYRAMMEDTFKDLIAILPALEGPDPDGAFRQQMHLLDQDRQQLIGLTFSASSETIVAAGTRASYTALEAVFSRNFSDSSDIGKSMDDLGAKLDELDIAHGDASKLAVAKSVQMISAIMREMDEVNQQRAAAAKAAAAAPSTSAAPSTAPSPATAPGM
jgi:hypothetical protein